MPRLPKVFKNIPWHELTGCWSDRIIEAGLDVADCTANVVVPAVQTGTHAVAGGAAAAANGLTMGQVDAIGEFQDSQFDQMWHTAENTAAGWAEKTGAVEPFFWGSSRAPEKDSGCWMADIPDETPVVELFVPGTHDTMTFTSGASYVKCQVWSLEDQLKAGLRAFDVRIKHVDDTLLLYHGAFDLENSFNHVVQVFETFLDENPSETILASLSAAGCPPCGEHSANYHEEISRRFSDPGRWVCVADWPTLGEVRGKVLLASVGTSSYGSAAPQDIQNYWKEADHTIKIQHVLDHALRPREPQVLYSNWLNAVGLEGEVMNNVYNAFSDDWAKSPSALAYQVNKGLFESLDQALPSVYFIDFPGADLIERIIARNFAEP